MELKELFDLHDKLENRVNAYWRYWMVVVIAIGGWLFSGQSLPLLHQYAISVLTGVMVFFFANLAVLWPAMHLVVGVRDEIRLKSKTTEFSSPILIHALAENTAIFRLWVAILLHIIIDCVVLWALWSAAR